jgi:hypothetical protein
MRRISFLPAFFIVLTIGFAIAVVLRVRSYQEPSSKITSAQRTTEASPATSASENRVANARPEDTPLGGTQAETGTIVDAQPANATTAALRQQRYHELLNASKNGGAAPSPAAVAPQAKPSLFSRIVAPIVNALGGSSSGAATAAGSAGRPGVTAAPRPLPPQQGRNNNNSTGSGTPASEKPGGSTEKEAPKDPNSDVTAPQLMGVEFNPPQVQDGEETVLAIMATDDNSGVRTISGNIISPSGSLQGFALQKEGETNRFVSRVLVPKDAAEGAWHINYLNLTDNANNSVTLSWQQGAIPQTAQFRVKSSRSDTTPPTLKAVWLDRQQMKTGEKNIVFVQADDDKSGVNLVSGVFLSPAKFARIGFGCRAQNGNVWECDLTPPGNADCGDWQLEQVQLQDKANNMTAIRSDNAVVGAVKVNISSDRCDSQPPVIQSVALDNPTIPAPGSATISIVATDDSSGVASISGHFVYTGKISAGNQPPRIYFSCRPSGDANTNIWQGPVAVGEPKQAKGLYKVGSIQVLDKANNLKLYQGNDPVVANVTLQVR